MGEACKAMLKPLQAEQTERSVPLASHDRGFWRLTFAKCCSADRVGFPFGGLRRLLSMWTSVWPILHIMDSLADFVRDWRLSQPRLVSIWLTLDVPQFCTARDSLAARLWTDSALAISFTVVYPPPPHTHTAGKLD